MRGIWISTALVTMALAASSASHAQFFSKTPQAADAPKTAAAPPQAPATAAPAPQAAPAPRAPCSNANALGVARTVEIDTTGGPDLASSSTSAMTSSTEGGRADVRRWPVADRHARSSRRWRINARRPRSSPSARTPLAIRTFCMTWQGRSHGRRPHQVARRLSKSRIEKMKDEIEKGSARSSIALGGTGSVLPLPVPADPLRRRISRRPQHRGVLDGYR